MIVHVDILVSQTPRNHCGAMNWHCFALADVANAGKKGFTTAEETDILL